MPTSHTHKDEQIRVISGVISSVISEDEKWWECEGDVRTPIAMLIASVCKSSFISALLMITFLPVADEEAAGREFRSSPFRFAASLIELEIFVLFLVEIKWHGLVAENK